jgi:sulfur carrier protein
MQIHLNGEQTQLAEHLTVQQLIEQMRLTGQRIAVELNGEIVPRSRWPVVELRAGDRAELVQAIGGG